MLGCDGSWPGPGGAGSGYLVRVGGTSLVLDCGPGSSRCCRPSSTPVRWTQWWSATTTPTTGRTSSPWTPRPVSADGAPPARLRSGRGHRPCRAGADPILDWRCVSDGDRAGIGEASCAFHRTDSRGGDAGRTRGRGGPGPGLLCRHGAGLVAGRARQRSRPAAVRGDLHRRARRDRRDLAAGRPALPPGTPGPSDWSSPTDGPPWPPRRWPARPRAAFGAPVEQAAIGRNYTL